MSVTFLDLVNTAIDEAGVDLDPLTPENFAYPPKTKMYERFKRWVNRAWRELQTDNLDWGLTQSRSVSYLFPRFTVRGIYGAFNTGDLITDSEGTPYGAVYKLTARPDGLFSLDLYSCAYTPAIGTQLFNQDGSYCFYVYTGEYELTALAPDVVDINKTEVTAGIGIDGGDRRLAYVPFSAWNGNNGLVNSVGTELPSMYTINSQHMIEFLPSITSPIYLGYSYSKDAYTLVNYNDVLKDFPDRFAPAVLWRAVMSYADYERDSALWMRANKNYHRAATYADISLGEQVTMGGWNV